MGQSVPLSGVALQIAESLVIFPNLSARWEEEIHFDLRNMQRTCVPKNEFLSANKLKRPTNRPSGETSFAPADHLNLPWKTALL